MLKRYDQYCVLPIRISRMRIQRGDRSSLEETFVPWTTVFVKPNGFLDEDHIDRDALTYTITNTKRPFPYGHIYAGSGHICLGSIFVPSKVPRYSPQQPLETLFLHNDRNVNHGGASLTVSKEQLFLIDDLLKRSGASISKETKGAFHPGINLVATDGLWLLGADICHQGTFWEGRALMEKIYGILFPEKEEEIQEKKEEMEA